VTVEIHGLPRRLSVAAGGQREISLPSYAGSGNAWSASCLTGEGVAAVAIQIGPQLPPAAVPGGGPPEPRLATEQAIIRGLRAGQSRWRLQLSRPFGPQEPTAAIDIDIEVTPG
jgi:hypothetical protein